MNSPLGVRTIAEDGNTAEFLKAAVLNDAGVDREAGADRRGRVQRFPSSLLYAINTKIGAHGLGVPALETLKLSHAHGFLGKAVYWGNLSDAIPKELIRSLHSHPTRLLSWMGRKYYTPLKRRTIAHIARQELVQRIR